MKCECCSKIPTHLIFSNVSLSISPYYPKSIRRPLGEIREMSKTLFTKRLNSANIQIHMNFYYSKHVYNLFAVVNAVPNSGASLQVCVCVAFDQLKILTAPAEEDADGATTTSTLRAMNRTSAKPNQVLTRCFAFGQNGWVAAAKIWMIVENAHCA